MNWCKGGLSLVGQVCWMGGEGSPGGAGDDLSLGHWGETFWIFR